MLTDLVADLLTRIRNAQRIRHRSVRVRHSRMSESVLKVLKSEGFIDSYEKRAVPEKKFEEFIVHLKYYDSGDPVIGRADRISKSGRRVYNGVEKLAKVHAGLGISILSTSQGVMSDREARKKKIGGEVLAIIS